MIYLVSCGTRKKVICAGCFIDAIREFRREHLNRMHDYEHTEKVRVKRLFERAV